jgi:hypothetical protein
MVVVNVKERLAAVKRMEFGSGRISYIILRGGCCGIVLNVHVTTGDKIGYVRGSFYEELERLLDKFPKCHIKILLRDFSAKLGKEDIKLTIGNESLHEISNDNGTVLFATSKNIIVKSRMFPRRNIYKYTRTSPDKKAHNQTDGILIDRRRNSSVLDVRSFRAANCDTGHYLVVETLGSNRK